MEVGAQLKRSLWLNILILLIILVITITFGGLAITGATVTDENLISIPTCSTITDEEPISIPTNSPSSKITDDEDLISIPENTESISKSVDDDELFSIPITPPTKEIAEDEEETITEEDGFFGKTDLGDPTVHCTINATNFTNLTDHLSCNNLTIEADGTLNASIYNVTAAGHVVIAGALLGGNASHSYGSLNVSAGASFNASTNVTIITSESAAGVALESRGNWTHNNGLVNITSNINTTIYIGNTTLFNLEIATGNVGNNVTLLNHTDLEGGLNILNGTLDTNTSFGHRLAVSGDVIINGKLYARNSSNITAGSLDINSGGEYNATTQTTTITSENNNLAFDCDGTFTHNNGTLNVTTVAATTADLTCGSGNLYSLQIATGGNMEWTADPAIDNNLTVSAGVFRQMNNARTLNVTKDVMVIDSGTLGMTTATGTLRFGSLTIESGAVYIATQGTTIITANDSAGHSLIIRGAITHNSGLVNITNTENMTADLGNVTLYDLEIAVGVGNNLTLLNHTDLAGGLNISNGTLDTNSSFGHRLSVTGNVIVDGILHGRNSSNVTLGSITIIAGATYNATNKTTTLTSESSIGRTLDNSGTFTHNSGNVEITTSATTNMLCGNSLLYDLTVDKTNSLILDGHCGLAKNLTIETGTLDANVTNHYNLTVSGYTEMNNGNFHGRKGFHNFGSLVVLSAATYNATSNITTITSERPTDWAFYLSDTDVFVHNNGTVNITTTADTRIYTNNEEFPFWNLSICGGKTQGYQHTAVENNLVVCNGAEFENCPAGLSPASRVNVTGDVIVYGTLDTTQGAGGEAAMYFGSLTIQSGGTYQATANTTTITSNDSSGYPIVIDGTFTANSGLVNITNTNANMTMNISGTSNLFDLEIAIGEINNITLLDHTDLEGGLNISSGTVDMNSSFGHRLAITGDVFINGTLHARNSSNVTLGSLNLTGTYNASPGITALTSEATDGVQLRADAGTIIHNNGTFKENYGSSTVWRTNDNIFYDVELLDGNLVLNSYGLMAENNLTYNASPTGGSFTSAGFTVNITRDVIVLNGTFNGGASNTHYFGSLEIGSEAAHTAAGITTTITSNNSVGHPLIIDGTWTHNSGKVNITNTNANMTLNVTNNLYDLEIAVGVGNNVTLLDNLTLQGLNVSSGTLDTNLSFGHRVSVIGDVVITGILHGRNSSNITLSSITIGSGGTYNSTTQNTTITGNLTVTGTFTHNNGTVVFNSAGFQNISGNNASLYNVDLRNAYTIVEGVNVSAEGTVTLDNNANFMIDQYYGVANDYRLWIGTLNNSQLVNGFDASNNLRIFNGSSAKGTFILNIDTNITDLTLENNACLNVTNDSILIVTGTTIIDSSIGLVNGTATNLTINNTKATYDGYNVTIFSVISKPTDPSNGDNIDKYVNLTNISENANVILNITYSAGDLGTANENNLEMWRNNGGWSKVPSMGINATQDYVWGNVSNFSTFALLVVTPTTTSTISGGSSGGGGAGTGATSTYWSSIDAGELTTMTIIGVPALPLISIDFTLLEGTTQARLAAEALTYMPTSITEEPSGIVYTYFDITATNIDETNLESATIKFRVEKTWINENNVRVNTIRLARWTDIWEILETKQTSEDVTYVNFEAITPGFSTFVIIAETMEGEAITALVTKEEVGLPTLEIPEELQEPANLAVLGALILVIIGVGYMFTRPRKKVRTRKSRKKKPKDITVKGLTKKVKSIKKRISKIEKI